MNCVKMRRRQRKTKDAFSIFAPYTLFPTQEFESIPEKTPLRPERRLMLAVLEETVAYVLELCRETEGSNQYGALSYISATRGFTVGLHPNHVSNTNSII